MAKANKSKTSKRPKPKAKPSVAHAIKREVESNMKGFRMVEDDHAEDAAPAQADAVGNDVPRKTKAAATARSARKKPSAESVPDSTSEMGMTEVESVADGADGAGRKSVVYRKVGNKVKIVGVAG